MIRIFFILIVSAASFFGIVFLIETNTPDVKTMTQSPDAEATRLNPHGLPSQIIGSFELNRDTSKQWLAKQNDLSEIDKSQFQEIHLVQQLYHFDGNHLWRESSETKIAVSTLEVTPDFVKLRSTVSLSGRDIPNDFYLQWDDQGFWLSQYLPGSDGNKKLYRARYEQTKEQDK